MYRNEAVEADIADELGVPIAAARSHFGQLLEQLDRLAQDSRQMAPLPNELLLAWQAFITHSRAYMAYCLAQFGQYLHHEPDAIVLGVRDRVSAAQQADQGSAGAQCTPYFPPPDRLPAALTA